MVSGTDFISPLASVSDLIVLCFSHVKVLVCYSFFVAVVFFVLFSMNELPRTNYTQTFSILVGKKIDTIPVQNIRGPSQK